MPFPLPGPDPSGSVSIAAIDDVAYQIWIFVHGIALHEVTALYKTDSGIVAWATISNYHDFTMDRKMLPLCFLTPLPRLSILGAVRPQPDSRERI